MGKAGRVLCLLVLALTACSAPSTVAVPPRTTDLTRSAAPVSAAEIGKAGLVHIQTGTEAGSGSYVGGDVVLTAAHVVAGAVFVKVDFASIRVAERAYVIAADLDTDLALVDVPGLETAGARALKWRWPNGLPDGSHVLAVGYPLGSLSVSDGVMARLRAVEGPAILVETDVHIDHGNSGGPLLDDAGELIGIASFIVPDVYGPSWFVSSQTAQGFVTRTDISKAVAAARTRTGVESLVPPGFVARFPSLVALTSRGQPFAWANGLVLTALAVREQDPIDQMRPAAGHRLVTVTVRCENRARQSPARIWADWFSLTDGSGRVHFVDERSAGRVSNAVGRESLSLGGSIDRTVTFEVPENDSRLLLEYSEPGYIEVFIRLYD